MHRKRLLSLLLLTASLMACDVPPPPPRRLMNAEYAALTPMCVNATEKWYSFNPSNGSITWRCPIAVNYSDWRRMFAGVASARGWVSRREMPGFHVFCHSVEAQLRLAHRAGETREYLDPNAKIPPPPENVGVVIADLHYGSNECAPVRPSRRAEAASAPGSEGASASPAASVPKPAASE